MDAITVIGGGGGAGATRVVAELAIALASLGRRVAAIDADLGLGNLDAILGIEPARSFGDVIAGRCTLAEALAVTQDGVRAAAAGRCQEGPRALTADERRRVIEQLDRLASDLDVLLIDAGPGVTPNTVFFAGAAQRIVLVLSPAADGRTKALATLTAVTTKLPKASVYILVNRARSAAEARETFAELARTTDPTLCADLHYLGALPSHEPEDAGERASTPLASSRAAAVREAAGALALQIFVPATPEHTRGSLWLSPR